jgi:hypothetical protein
LSENYYNRSRVYDRDGNFLHMDTRDDTSSIIREGYWSYDYEEQLNEEFRYYEEQKEKEQELKLNQKGS